MKLTIIVASCSFLAIFYFSLIPSSFIWADNGSLVLQVKNLTWLENLLDGISETFLINQSNLNTSSNYANKGNTSFMIASDNPYFVNVCDVDQNGTNSASGGDGGDAISMFNNGGSSAIGGDGGDGGDGGHGGISDCNTIGNITRGQNGTNSASGGDAIAIGGIDGIGISDCNTIGNITRGQNGTNSASGGDGGDGGDAISMFNNGGSSAIGGDGGHGGISDCKK